MSCPCSKWEQIDHFRSPGEYQNFVKWINEQVTNCRAIEVPVEECFDNSSFDERWFTCISCNRKWRLVAPDPPFYGLFEPLNPSTSKGSFTING